MTEYVLDSSITPTHRELVFVEETVFLDGKNVTPASLGLGRKDDTLNLEIIVGAGNWHSGVVFPGVADSRGVQRSVHLFPARILVFRADHQVTWSWDSETQAIVGLVT